MRTTVAELLDARPIVSIGMLTADLLVLGEQLALLKEAGGTVVHVDVMDGVFCPQFTVGPPIVKAIPDHFIKDCHLMIGRPLEKLAPYVDAGAGIVTFHLEAAQHPHRVLQSLAHSGVVRGVALNPGTPLTSVEPLIDDMELLLLLAVNPGWGGQKFIPATERRLAAARELIGRRKVLVGLDGGVTRANVGWVAGLGADLLVTGSAVFDGTDPLENAHFMISAIRRQWRPSHRRAVATGPTIWEQRHAD